MEGLKGLDLEAIGEAIGTKIRGSAEIRPWLFAGDLLCAALLDTRGSPAALDLWKKLRDLLRGRGVLPVVVGSPGDSIALEDKNRTRTREELAQAIATALTTSGAKVLERLAGERREANEELDPENRLDLELERLRLEPADLEVKDEPFAFVEESKGRVSIALVPTGIPALVPVYLGFGGTGDAPEASDIAAVLALWNERHGPLEVVFTSGDTLEVEIGRPPRTIEDVRRLTLEHHALCDSLVSHGDGSTEKLAAELAGRKRWLFWWES
jgi:hypothetical protein